MSSTACVHYLDVIFLFPKQDENRKGFEPISEHINILFFLASADEKCSLELNQNFLFLKMFLMQ